MIKIIVTDMDGTLLNDNNEINEEFWEIYEKLKDKGIMFSAASGRQLYNLQKRFEPIKNEMLFIAENGTFVTHGERELFCNYIDRESAIELIKKARKVDTADVIFCGKKAAYVEHDNEKFLEEVRKYYERYEVVEDLTKVEDEVLKITLCDFAGAEDNSYNHFKEYKDRFKVVISGKIWLDITNYTANKGNALKAVQELLGITSEETMVFGDYLNDLEMMGEAKYSFAMENAHPELKQAANYIAESNNNNGVIKTIKKMVLKV